MTVRLGAAYEILNAPMNKLLVSAEASKVLANEDPLLTRLFNTGWQHMDETIYGVGAEYTYLDLISLRGGYFLDTAGSVVGPSFGAGIQYTFSKKYKLTADFSMVPGGELVDFNKVFSLGFEFRDKVIQACLPASSDVGSCGFGTDENQVSPSPAGDYQPARC